MKDHEIIMFLKQPAENDKQRRAMDAAERAFRRYCNTYELDDDLEFFFSDYTADSLIGVESGKLYEDYKRMCSDYGMEIKSHIYLTKAVKYLFNLRIVQSCIDGKTKRIFSK